jgi:hypothetical protein
MHSALRSVIVVATFESTLGKLVTFSNKLPRLDTSGNIINAHDGTTRRYGAGAANPFYYTAMGYPGFCNETGQINGCTSCIYGINNTITVWSSPDLSSGSWEVVSPVYPGTAGFPPCTYFRSQAVYNPATRLHVLWANVAGCAKGVTSQAYATATAPSPAGPYTFHGFTSPPNVTGGFIGDFALFVDSDGSAYTIITHGIDGAGYREMVIFSLSADFLSFGDSSTSVLPGPNLVEAPAFFRRGSTYYALLGGCTCMGLYGGGVAVLTAPAPLGPWTNVTSTLDPGCPMEKQSTCFEMGPGAICNPVTQAQQNFVIEVPLADGTTAYVWTGDKWQQSPDGTYAEQPQTWLPLSFDGDTILPFSYVDSFSLDVAA